MSIRIFLIVYGFFYLFSYFFRNIFSLLVLSALKKRWNFPPLGSLFYFIG
nr:MAG TPA: hypothetical protein [Caudoviricetes sp.]